MTKLSDRPTGDIVILFLASLLVVIVVSILALVIYSEVRYPGESPISLIRPLGEAASTLTAALIGYIAGRGNRPSTTPTGSDDGGTDQL